MKISAIVLAAGTALALAVTSCFPPPIRVIWNRTSSAPQGLYWLQNREVSHGVLVSISPHASASKWAQERGYVGQGWPLLKTVAGLKGDEICRCGDVIYVNQKRRAAALQYSQDGAELPRWQGCVTLVDDEVFLLSQHPSSLDGRYFGVMSLHNVDGVAVLLVEF